MRKIKQTVCFLLALIMLSGCSLKASACTIVIEENTEGTAGGSYVAYQLMSTTSATGSDGNGTYAYYANAKYSSVLREATGQSTDEAAVSAIGALSDSSDVRTLANTIYSLILTAGLEADATSDSNAFSGLASGYYLIAEAPDSASSGTSQAYSLVILTTVSQYQSTVTVTSKETVPTLTKKVKESVDGSWASSISNPVYAADSASGWQDAADYDMGDSVPFRLTATLSDNYEGYSSYALTFHDTLSSGLTFEEDSLKVYIDGTELGTDDYVLTDNTSDQGGGTFSVKITNLKNLNASVTVSSSSSAVVEYTAVLNTNAAVGYAGNDNKAYLEYSNNPYGDGTGTTPEDIVRVFTFELLLKKIDSNKQELKGAGFILYKEVADGSGSSWVKVGEEQVGSAGAELSQFSWVGLDSGTYKLQETVTPQGYTGADEIVFRLEGTYQTASDDPQMSGISSVVTEGEKGVYYRTADIDTGLITLWVVNKNGNLMPSTGGAGTAGIYLSGGMLILAALLLLAVSRHRKRS